MEINNSLIPLMQNSLESCVIEYDDIKKELKELFGNCEKLDLEISSIKSPFHKIYYKIKKKLFKQEYPTVEDLITIQQKLIKGIRQTLEQQLMKTEKSYGLIQQYSNNLDENLANYLNSKSKQKKCINKLKEELIKSKSELFSIEKSSPDYYHKRNEVKELLRHYKINSSSYTRNNEAIKDTLMMVSDITYREELISLSLEQSKSIVESSKRYEEFLGIIRCAYSDFIKQTKLYAALFSTIKRSKDFIQELDRIVLYGEKEITNYSNKLSTQKYYTNPLIEEITSDIVSSYETSKSDLDLDIEYRLNS